MFVYFGTVGFLKQQMFIEKFCEQEHSCIKDYISFDKTSTAHHMRINTKVFLFNKKLKPLNFELNFHGVF